MHQEREPNQDAQDREGVGRERSRVALEADWLLRSDDLFLGHGNPPLNLLKGAPPAWALYASAYAMQIAISCRNVSKRWPAASTDSWCLPGSSGVRCSIVGTYDRLTDASHADLWIARSGDYADRVA